MLNIGMTGLRFYIVAWSHRCCLRLGFPPEVVIDTKMLQTLDHKLVVENSRNPAEVDHAVRKVIADALRAIKPSNPL